MVDGDNGSGNINGNGNHFNDSTMRKPDGSAGPLPLGNDHQGQEDGSQMMNGGSCNISTATIGKANKAVQFQDDHDDEDNDDGTNSNNGNHDGDNDRCSSSSSSASHQRLLRELGFEFRFVPCPLHEYSNNSNHHKTSHGSNGISNNNNEHTPTTSSSTTDSSSSSRQPISLAKTSQCQSGRCSTQLFHNTTNEMMTLETYPLQDHVPKGPIFDQVQKRAQQYVQSKLCEDFNMHLIPLFGDDVHALVSDSLIRDPISDEEDEDDNDDTANFETTSIEEGYDEDEDEDENEHDGSIYYSKMKQRHFSYRWDQSQRQRHYQQRKNTLIVIGGKGISRCGLVSVRQLLGAGIERGSCSYHIQTALRRKWHVIVLDPNAEGKWTPRGGFDVITKSLDRLLFMDSRPESISSRIMGMDDDDDSDSDDSDDDDENFAKNGGSVGGGGTNAGTTTAKKKPNLYFFCHSAAGGHIVRYLLDQTINFQRRIAKLCFSDSTHRLSWADPKDHMYLHNVLLQDPQYALYIRNNSLGRDYPLYKTPMPGDDCGDTVDHWWIHRYGNLRTVWAGTADHSLMVFEARKVVWDFFDDKPTDHSSSNEKGRRSSDALDLAQADKKHSNRRSFLRKSTAHF